MDPSAEFLKQGLLGSIIIVLAGVILMLYKENKSLSKENRDLAEKRVLDLIQMKDAYFANAQAMKDAYFANQQGLKDIVESVLNIVLSLKEKLK